MASSSGRSGGTHHHQHQAFSRQATILRKNLNEWDRMLRTPRGEDWPTMLGRLNAALNQAGNLDRSIEDLFEHFVYVPKKSTANAQDIPFFLSTRLEDSATINPSDPFAGMDDGEDGGKQSLRDPVQTLSRYENAAAQLAAEYEENMTRF